MRNDAEPVGSAFSSTVCLFDHLFLFWRTKVAGIAGFFFSQGSLKVTATTIKSTVISALCNASIQLGSELAVKRPIHEEHPVSSPVMFTLFSEKVN